jgi:O-antigen ligase
MGLSMNLLLDPVFAFQLHFLKKPLLLMFIIISILSLKSISRLQIGSIIQLLLFLFPLYYLIISVFYKEEINISVVIMYFLWWVYLSISVPIMNSNEKVKSKLLRYVIYSSIIILLFGVYAFMNDKGYFGQDRLSFGYENPNYFAQYIQVGLIALVILKNGFKRISKITWLLIFLSIFLVILSVSRNVIVFILIFVLWYMLFNVRIKGFLKYLFIVLSIFIVTNFNYSDVNKISSGRLIAWKYQIDELSSHGDYSFLFGAKKYIGQHYSIPTYGRFTETENKKIHSDNIFLEVFLESGFIGIMFFVIPFFFLWKNLKHVSLKERRLYESFYVGAFVQGFFITNFTSFFAPASLILGLIIMAPISKKNNNK